VTPVKGVIELKLDYLAVIKLTTYLTKVGGRSMMAKEDDLLKSDKD
jgi:hypothetical protein